MKKFHWTPQMKVYRDMPHQYDIIAKQVYIAMFHQRKPCLDESCDDAFTCKRHSRTVTLVRRYLRRIQ